MPLITCPDCTREHSDLAPSCPQCGRPNGAVAVAAQRPVPVVPLAPGPKSAHACPKCGSEQAQKLSVIFQGGTSLVNAVTAGAHTAGISQSIASKNAAPPQRRSIGCGAATLMGLGAFITVIGLTSSATAFFIGAIMFAFPASIAYSHHKWNTEEFPKLYAHWDATFQCTRCGTRFVPQR